MIRSYPPITVLLPHAHQQGSEIHRGFLAQALHLPARYGMNKGKVCYHKGDKIVLNIFTESENVAEMTGDIL